MARPSPSPGASSSSSSGTPPPTVSASKKQKTTTKSKGKTTDAGKNEGVDLNWAYAPPSDRVCITEDVDAEEFDWDAVKNDDDVELWLIRVPDSVKPKYLENIKVDIPSSSKSARIGTLTRKHMSYDIWSVGDDADNLPTGGEEIKSLSCLLPRKGKKGALYPAPKPIARHIVVSAQPVKPTLATSIVHQNPARFAYPEEVLKHRYVPYNSVAVAEPQEVNTMDIDVLPEEPVKSPEVPKTAVAKVKDEAKASKGKKRKGDVVDAVDTPTKKTKKSKVA
ncbi:hypothetical protein BDN70DRAFT_856166 [Pholiota conissans]|uniref:Uncharacterized protein n=1 Tax=Pholiota conissans TaxID=109636 RepID=A0A9P6CVL8_9AGAR|nr:hypothetical protein BDN70DRAFT_856166 [Pholiota conissans]